MPRYRVGTYITQFQEVIVEADSPEEALGKASKGDGEDVGDPEFIDMETGSMADWQVENTATGEVWTQEQGVLTD